MSDERWWDSDKPANPLEAALVAEGVSGTRAAIARSIYEQESGSGSNTTTSWAKARGGMQVIPGTFASVADKGWSIDDPEQNARAGVRYINKLFERAGGDPRLTAIGYYGGEGGQDQARKGKAVRPSDPRGAKDPDTFQYADKVVSRIVADAGEGDWWAKDPKAGDAAGGAAETAAKAAPAAPLGADAASLIPTDGYQKAPPADAIPPMTAASLAQDALSSGLQLGPQLVKSAGEITRMATGDTLGKGLTDFADTGIKSIQDVVGSDRAAAQREKFARDMADPNIPIKEAVLNNQGAMSDMLLPSLGSMLIPVGAAKMAETLVGMGKFASAAQATAAIDKAQKAAVLATIGAQNAGSTYSTIRDKGGDQPRSYLGAAITLPFSYLGGKLTGGGAEGALVRGMGGKAGAGLIAAARQLPGAAGREGFQETTEQTGQYLGEALGTGEELNANLAAKQIGVAGLMGTVAGGSLHMGGALASPRPADASAPEPPPAPKPTIADIGAATSVDQAIAAAQAVVSTPAPLPGVHGAVVAPLSGVPGVVAAPLPGVHRVVTGDPAAEAQAMAARIAQLEGQGLAPEAAVAAAVEATAAPAPNFAQTSAQPLAVAPGAVPEGIDRAAQVQAEIARLAAQREQAQGDRQANGRGLPAETSGIDAALPEAPVDTAVDASGAAPNKPIVQNRNRTSDASIAQVRSIGKDPDYGRMGFSRDFSSGAPVVVARSIPAAQLGRKDVAVASNGRRIPVQYAVVSASQMLTSHNADGVPNAAFANRSAADLYVVAGHGRGEGLRLAFQQGTAQGYREEMAADDLHGIDPAAIQSVPDGVVVRVMAESEVTKDIGDLSNTSGVGDLNVVEQAHNDMHRVTLDDLAFAPDGSITPDVVRRFVQQMPLSERSGLMDSQTGGPNRIARDRLDAAVFARAYGNDGLIRLYAEAQDSEARLILSAIAQVAPKMARLEGLGALDIRPLLAEAAEIAVNARRSNVSLKRAAQQMDLKADPDTRRFLELFARWPRSVKPVVEALSDAADFAYTEFHKPAEDIFGATEPATRADVLKRLDPFNERAGSSNLEDGEGGLAAREDAVGYADERPGPRNAQATEAGRSGQDGPGRGGPGATREDAGVAREQQALFAPDEENDLFTERSLPDVRGKDRPLGPDGAGLRGDVQPAPAVPARAGPGEDRGGAGSGNSSSSNSSSSDTQDTPATPGEYYVRTLVGVSTRRPLGAAVITTPAQAAQATQYLYRSAVERFDGIVTDADGKPLAVIGGFKGATAEARIFPGTLLAEAVRVPGAARIWFSHNHPSGRADLSRSDEGINQTLTDAFKGSGIEPMGLLAVAGSRFTHVSANGNAQETGAIAAATDTAPTVPVVERELGPKNAPRTAISSPAHAKEEAQFYYKRQGGPGLLLLNTQNQPVAWVPIGNQMAGKMRGTGGLNAIYRAVSESNAHSAVIVHGGELDATVEGGGRGQTISSNIANALQRTEVRALDSINVKTGASVAESGGQLRSTDVLFSKRGGSANPYQNDLFGNPMEPGSSTRGQQGLFDEPLTGKQATTEAQADRAVEQAEQVEPAEPGFDFEDAPAETGQKAEAEAQAIADFGEKIGGARKDTATTPRRGLEREVDERPVWARKYLASQNPDTGKWELFITKGQFLSRPSRSKYASQQEALDAVPLMEAAQNHRVYGYTDEADGSMKFGIWRIFSTGKRAMVKGGFASDEDAMRALAADPVSVIEHKFEFPERPWLDNMERTGPKRRDGDATPAQFQQAFGFRGGEFGNWNMGGDGQATLNHAYDALMDLADILGIPPRALSLNGDLAIAFGARGTGGKGGGRAHYEREYGVINLTKIKGAGSLAHEWFHALDHYMGRLDGKSSSEKKPNDRGDMVFQTGKADRAPDYVSHGFGRKSNAREELRAAFTAVMDAIKGKPVETPVKTDAMDKRLKSQQDSVDYRLRDLRQNLIAYAKKPPTAEQLATFDALSARLARGDVGESIQVRPQNSSRLSAGRLGSSVVAEMSAIYKAVVGRGFDKTDYDSPGARLHVEAGNLGRMIGQSQINKERAAKGETDTVTHSTDYYQSARRIDGNRASAYWSTWHELGARAFESFILDQTAKRAERSDYLVYGAENRFYEAFGVKPYPEGDERLRINDAFEALFKAVLVRDTDKGAALYSEAQAPAPKTPVTRVRAAIERAYGRMLGRLEQRGLVSLHQTQDAAIEAAAAARAKVNGTSVDVERSMLAGSVSNSVATDTPAFERWFAGSKVVDADGKPLVVYHGTTGDFDIFDTAAGPRSQMVGDWDGVHFTNDREQAQSIADSLARRDGGRARVVEAYLRAENPAPFGKYRTQGQAVAAGHDSRLTENNTGLQEWAVFRPEQIKSATGNNGEFDPNNPSILRSADGHIQGFHDPATGQSFLIADHLTESTAPGVLLHEIGIHAANDGTFDPVYRRADMMLRAGRGNPFFDGVRERMEAARETSAEEAAAYLVEAYERDRIKAPRSVARWVRDFVATVRAWLNKRGVLVGVNDLTAADIAAMARSNARALAAGRAVGGKAGGTMRSMRPSAPQYPMAGRTVDGRIVREDVPNRGSIASSLDEFTVLDGVREVPLAAFDLTGKAYSVAETGRIKRLAEQIEASGEINPLIVVIDAEGPYILEGGHRAEALHRLGAKSLPAVVVMDESGGGGVKESKGDGPSRLNSRGNPIAADARGLRNFWNWYSGGHADAETTGRDDAGGIAGVAAAAAAGPQRSGPVDAQARPVVFFHGTRDDIGAFDLDHPNRKDRGWLGRGVYGTSDPDFGGDYAGAKRGAGHPSVMPLYFAVTNPYIASPETKRKLSRASQAVIDTFTQLSKDRGHDGVTLTHDDGTIEIVAFEPTQVKSATGNSGAFDGNNPDIRFSKSTPAGTSATPSGWSVPESGRLDKLIYNLQDGRIDLKRVQESITAATGALTDQFDARLAETLYMGRVAKRSADFLKLEAAPMLESMARNGVGMDELSDYMLARHAPERNAQIAKVNPKLQDGGAGSNSAGVLMTDAAAAAHLAGLPAARRDLLKLMAAKVDAITAGTRRLLVAEGLEKQSTIDAWTGAYKNYVPLFKEEAEDGGMPAHPQGSGFSVKGGASKRSTGSTKEVTNMLAHVLMQREAALTRAEKNRVSTSLYALALANPNNDFWTTVRPNMKAADLEQSLIAMGIDPAAAAAMDKVPTIRSINKATGLVQDTPNPVYKNMPNALVVKVGGEDRVILFNEREPRAMRLAENLKNMDGISGLDLASSIVGRATRLIASLNTQYNPAFGMVNLTRDLGGAMVNLSSTPIAGQQLKVLANVPAAVTGIARAIADNGRTKWSDLFDQFQKDGGQTGYRELLRDPFERAKQIERELKKLADGNKPSAGRAAHAVLDLLDGFNTTLENAVRLSAYKAALDAGMSRPQAARLGRELTVDFNRKGRAGRELGPLYAFFNASIQGTARTIVTLKGPAGAKIIAGGLALGVMQALLLAAAGFDDDEIPDFDKARAFIIPIGGKEYISIPIALGLHVLPNTGRILTELTMSGGKKAGKKLFESLGEIAGAFSPLGGGNVFTGHGFLTTLAPTVIDPIVDLTANQNFAGNKISKESFPGDRRPRWQLGRESTERSTVGPAYTGIAKALNKISGGGDYKAGYVNATPEEIRYVIGSVGGGLYREVEKTANAIALMGKGESVKARDVPFGSRFHGEVDSDAVERSRYFENSNRVKDVSAQMKGAASEGDGDAYRATLDANRTEAVMAKSFAKIGRDLNELNRLAMDSIGDREKLKQIDETRVALMRSLNETFKRVEKGVEAGGR